MYVCYEENIKTHCVKQKLKNHMEPMLPQSLGTSDSEILGVIVCHGELQGDKNVLIGYQSGTSITSGNDNICIGNGAGDIITTGSNGTGGNVCIGKEAGDSITTGTKNICIGQGTDVDSGTAVNRIAIGINTVNTADNTVIIGNGTNTISNNCNSTAWTAASDLRLKENIESSNAGMQVINDLRPVTFNWKKKKEIDPALDRYYKENSEDPALGKKYGTKIHGFIAQEVKSVIDKHPEIKDGFGMWRETGDGVQELGDGALMPIVVKALQELKAENDQLKARIEALENK